MQRGVPHYSQFLDVKNKLWQPLSCGIVSLKIVLDYWHQSGRLRRVPPSIPALNRLGHEMEAYVWNRGWSHRGLVLLARRFGLHGENLDWASLPSHAAFRKLLPLLRRGPVIASIYRYPREKRGGHLVVVTEVEAGKVYLLDPIAKTRSRIPRIITRKAFLEAWKRRIVVVRPRLRKRR